MNTRTLMELASATQLPKPKESRELVELRQAWAWALPSVQRAIRDWALIGSASEPTPLGRHVRQCRRLLEIVDR